MRPTTIALQALCVVLGCAFIWSTFALSSEALAGGLIVGSLMFMAAAFLGADHTTNATASTPLRLLFKAMAVLATLPVLGIGAHGAVALATHGRWSEALSSGVKLLLLIIALALLVFHAHPKVQRILRRRGISSPGSQRDGHQAP